MKQKFIEEVSQQELYDAKNPFVRYAHRKRLEKVIEFLGETKNKTVLDLGCGEGFMLERVNGKAIGLDYSMLKLAKAKERLGKALLVRGDATRLPFKKNVFDAFIASEVLEHIPDLKIVAKEVSRSAKKEYIVVVSAPNERNWEIARLFMLRFPLKLEGHVNSITPKGLDEIFCSKASRKENIPRLPFDFCLTQIAAYQMSNR